MRPVLSSRTLISRAAGSWIPNKTRIGSSSGPSFNRDNQGLVSVRRGDSTGANAHFQARAFAGAVVTLNNQSGTVTLDIATGSIFIVTLTGNVTSWTLSNGVVSGEELEVHFLQDGTGSRTLAGAGGAMKLAGGALTLTTTASKRDILRFRNIGGQFWETSRSMNVG